MVPFAFLIERRIQRHFGSPGCLFVETLSPTLYQDIALYEAKNLRFYSCDMIRQRLSKNGDAFVTTLDWLKMHALIRRGYWHWPCRATARRIMVWNWGYLL